MATAARQPVMNSMLPATTYLETEQVFSMSIVGEVLPFLHAVKKNKTKKLTGITIPTVTLSLIVCPNQYNSLDPNP